MKMQQIFEILADRIAGRECMKQMMARRDDSRERDREDLKKMMKEMNTTTDAIQAKADSKEEEMLARMREDIKSGQGEIRSTLDKWLMVLKDGRKETTAYKEVTETKLDPGLMQSIEAHQDIHKGEVAVMPVEESMKRRRVCNLAAERPQKRKERTRRNRGSRRKLAAAYRKVPRRAKVEWRKRKLVKRIGIHENWTAKEVLPYRNNDDPLCKSGTAQGEHRLK
jgi:hypothetical protein